MALPARKLEAVEFMEERIALEERVKHVQCDVAEVKGDIRRLDSKIDAVRVELADARVKLIEAIGVVRAEIAASALSTTRWMIGTMVATISVASAIAFGVAKLVSS